MPEREREAPRPGEELVLEAEPVATTAQAVVVEGAGAISPVIIIPPVVIAVIMSFLLAMVYGVTKVPIAEAKKADKRDKLGEVMPVFENDPLDLEQALTDVSPGKAGNSMLYTGTVEDGVSGYGITSAVGSGYSGYFSVVFGLDIEGNITSVKILETMETPGLGTKAGEPAFIDQFTGRSLADTAFAVVKDGGDIDAVTGATITSRAVCEAVEQGLENFEQTADATQAEPVEIGETEEAAEGRSKTGGWTRPGGDG